MNSIPPVRESGDAEGQSAGYVPVAPGTSGERQNFRGQRRLKSECCRTKQSCHPYQNEVRI